jgi:hypothetical protein
VHDIQEFLPGARVCYVSATGASSLDNLGYMTRLGLWGHDNDSLFDDFQDFQRAYNSAGVGALELIGAWCDDHVDDDQG